MPRRPAATQAAIRRTVQAVESAGFPVGRVEVEGAKVIVYRATEAKPVQANAFDQWEAKRRARSA